MIVIALAAWLLVVPLRGAEPKNAEKPAVVSIQEWIKDDQNAVRRARYALRKAAKGTSEEEAARKRLADAKAKLKEDRLRLKDERKRRDEKTVPR